MSNLPIVGGEGGVRVSSTMIYIFCHCAINPTIVILPGIKLREEKTKNALRFGLKSVFTEVQQSKGGLARVKQAPQSRGQRSVNHREVRVAPRMTPDPWTRAG